MYIEIFTQHHILTDNQIANHCHILKYSVT